MTQDNPGSSNGNGNGGDKPPANRHSIALAIEALYKEYKTAQSDRAQHEGKTLFWARLAGMGVGVYTLLTVVAVGLSYSALRNAQDTEQRQLRAYAYVAPNLPTLQPNGNAADLVFAVRALGPTLAYDVQTTIYAGGSGIPLQDDKFFAAHPPADRCVDNATILDPTTKDHTVHLPVSTFKVTDTSLTAIQSPNSRLYAWGEMYYRDIFSCWHWTRYCYQIGGTPLHIEECQDQPRNARNDVDQGTSCEPKRPPFEPIPPKACQRTQ